jgi:hypothetical protein
MCSINHEKKAIFINVPKTARSYISSTLCKYYGFKEYLQPCKDHEIKYEKYTKLDRACLFFNKIDGIYKYYKNSKSLNQLMNMDEEKWNTYFKFCFVRNPYERVISGFFYIQQLNPPEFLKTFEKTLIPFNQYIKNPEKNNYVAHHIYIPQSFHIIDENNNIAMDFIGRYENLENDFITILKKLNFDIIHEQKIINKSIHKDYTKYIDSDEILNIVNNYYEQDFKLLNYEKINNIN